LEQAIPFIVLHQFSRNDRGLYRAYRELKYEVFVEEQGWHSLADDSALMVAREDEFDARGRFWMASTEGMIPVGIVRGTLLKEGFPRRELLEHHLRQPEVAEIVASLCTINGLAVRRSYRRDRYRVQGRGWTGTISRLLMLAVIHDLEMEGMEAAIATAGGLISALLCESLGFIAIDMPQRTRLHPELIMINIGLVFGSFQHVRAQEECGMRHGGEVKLSPQAARLLAYFEERRATLLGSKHVADILGNFVY
jgi:hypothetical protein